MSQVPEGLVLALHPNRRGFGWIAFEGPFAPFEWGTACISKGLHGESLRRIEGLLDRLRPSTLVVEAIEDASRQRAARLVKAIAVIAAERSLEFAVYAKNQVKACFATVGAVSRQDIAESVGRILAPLKHLVPRPRRAWEKEAHHMSLFSAAALGLVYFQLGAGQLFEALV